jgi:hypothetical protein
VDALLAREPELKAVRLQTRGDFLIHYAWEARGSGFAGTVTEEGFKKFHERLTQAREALNECWEVKPGDHRTATLMLTVEKGSGGERDEMEKWFERAMKACPINKRACEAKMDWLDPKWHGSREELLAFGRSCRDTKNWRAGIPLLLADAHLRASQRLPQGEQKLYLISKEVRDDVVQVYEEYLKQFPDDNVERSRYAAYCVVCGLPTVADAQFKKLGDDLVYFRQWPEAWMKQVRESVAHQAAGLKAAREKAEKEKAELDKLPPFPPPSPPHPTAPALPQAPAASSSRNVVVAAAVAGGAVLVVAVVLVGVAVLAVRRPKKSAASRRGLRRAEDD